MAFDNPKLRKAMEQPIDNAPSLAEVVNENVELKQRIAALEKELEYIGEEHSALETVLGLYASRKVVGCDIARAALDKVDKGLSKQRIAELEKCILRVLEEDEDYYDISSEARAQCVAAVRFTKEDDGVHE